MADEKEIELTSLCYVGRDKTDRLWLFRLADIVDGEVVPFEVDEEAPRYFGNRTRLFSRAEQLEEGTAGVWSWKAIPNLSAPDKDYVESSFVPGLEPIEIIVMPGAWTPKKLGEALREGVEQTPVAKKALYCFAMQGDLLGGLLCTPKELEVSGKQAKIREGVTSLDYYVIRDKNRLTLKSTEMVPWKDFYRLLNLGKVSKKIFVMSPGEIVKSILTKKMTWTNSKPYVSRTEWKLIREFLGKMADVDLTKEVAAACECTEEEAQAIIQDFMDHGEKYVLARDVQESALLAAMERDPEMIRKCEDSLATRWRRENREEVEKAEKELAEIRGQVDMTREQIDEKLGDRRKELLELEKKLEEGKKELEETEARLKKDQALGEEVRRQVSGQVARAKEDASQLISSLLLSWPLEGLGASRNAPGGESSAPGGEESPFTPGRHLPPDQLMGYESWQELMGILMDELQRAGVAEELLTSLAAFLFSSYRAGAPVLLAGPGGEAIAHAFSAAVFGRMAGVLDCSLPYSPAGEKEIFSRGDQVILVRHPFDPDWTDHLPGLLLPPRRFYLLSTPFAEDLRLEPAGWQNYVLPVLTELFLEDLPMDSYVGGTRLPGFAGYEMVWEEEAPERLQKLRVGPLAKNRMKLVLANTRLIAGDEGQESLYLYGLLPDAYLKGRSEDLREQIQKDGELSPAVLARLKAFLGEE